MEYQKLIELVITSITSIIVALIASGVLKSWQDKKKEKKSREGLIARIKKDELVHFALRELRRLYNCDRIFIIQYHNGGNFYTESPMQKSTMTYERCSDGLERLSEKYQNVLVSHFNWYIRHMVDSKMFYTDLNKIEDISTRAFLISYGTQSHIACPIYDRDNHLIGMLGMDWVFSEPPSDIIVNDEFSEDFKKEVLKESNSLNTQI
jgi:hypothetical protein